MPVDIELLSKIISPAEEKKLKVYMNYIMYDLFSDKVSFPVFKERMEILNQVNHFNILSIFKQLCGKNGKYITLSRLVEAYMGYKTNSPEYTTEFKNFMSFIVNELIGDYNDKSLGAVTKTMKEFSTKNQVNRKAITTIEVYGNSKKEIVGVSIEYDEKNKNKFIAPSYKGDFEAKITCSLKINEAFITKTPEGQNENDDDNDFARDYITHIFGTHTSCIESIGFKTAFGKHYFTGKPTKGRLFLIGSTKSRFHVMKFGMDEKLNCMSFKFKSALHNPSLNIKFGELKDEDFEVKFPDEKILASMEEGHYKDQMIMTPIHCEKDINKNKDDDDNSGDSFDELCGSDSESEHEEEDKDKLFFKLVNELDDNDIKKMLINRKKEEDLALKKVKTAKVVEEAPVVVEEPKKEKKKKVNPEDFKKYAADQVLISDIIENPNTIDTFVDKYTKVVRQEITEQINLKEKINIMKNDFYIKYLNRKKEVKDWEQFEKQLDQSCDPNDLQKSLIEIVSKSEEKIDHDEEISEEAYEKYDTKDKKDNSKWVKFSRFLNRKYVLVYLRECLLNLAKNVLVAKENDTPDAITLNLLDKVSLLKQIIKLKKEKNIIAATAQESKKQEEIKEIKAKNKVKKEKKESIRRSIDKQADISKTLNKKSTMEINKPLTDPEVEVLLKKKLDKIIEILPAESKKYKAEYKKLLKIIAKKLINPSNGEFFLYVNTIKKLNNWIAEKEINMRKEKLTTHGEIDVETIKKEDLEKRKKMLDQNKEEKLKEKKEVEDIKASKIKVPVQIGNLIKEDNTQIKIYRKQQIPKNERFDDLLFKPSIESLCPFDTTTNKFVLPADAFPDDVVDWETFEWSEFNKIFKGNNFQVFLDKIEEGDIIQGGLGDCYFLSAIAALTKYPECIRKLFLFQERSEEGCYAVNYRINGQWKLVLVDEKIPSTGGNRPDFVFSMTNSSELWVVLLEKAWAKLSGNYIRAVGGLPSEVFDCVTNSMTENITITSKIVDLLWQKFKLGKEKNFIMTAGTGNSPNLDYDGIGLMTGHAYTVIDSVEFFRNGVQTRLVKLRNPWGNSEFSGDWSDNSNLWTDKLKKELNVTNNDDGIFFMTLDDFIKYYVIFQLCHLYPDYHHTNTRVKKEDTLDPVVTLLKVEKQSKAFIQIHQKNPRFQLKDGSYPKNSYCYVMILDEQYNFIGSSASDYHVESIEVDLKPGNYFVVTDVSYRYIDKNKLHGYTVTAISENPVEFYTCDAKFGDVIEKGLACYVYKNNLSTVVKGTEEYGGVKVFNYAKYGTHVPYIYSYIENYTKSDVLAVMELKGKTGVEFLDHNKSNKESILIKPSEKKTIIVRKYYPNSKVEFAVNTAIIFSNTELEQITEKKAPEENLEKSGKFSVKTHLYDGGYGIILKNKDSKANEIKFKFNLTNLDAVDWSELEQVLSFKPNEKKFIHLKAIDVFAPFSYSYSFSFNN